ncbi:MAG: hypothetical protein EOO62_04310, partial [Hymenobacter sp.]
MAESTFAAAPEAAEPLVVMGAGLVGSLLALYLARRGHPVQVFERLPDPRTQGLLGGRSINLALSDRPAGPACAGRAGAQTPAQGGRAALGT